jgi:hypothetical protein
MKADAVLCVIIQLLQHTTSRRGHSLNYKILFAINPQNKTGIYVSDLGLTNSCTQELN